MILKKKILRIIIDLLKRVHEKPDGQRILFYSMPYMDEVRSRILIDDVSSYADPYRDSSFGFERDDVINNENVIFITGRFRSGSTLLWNIFRDIPDTTSYYEPFNERQWFNTGMRGGDTDDTHLGVEDYWREYDGLGSLSQYFKEEWGDKRLYMTASSYDPGMVRYIDELIRAGDKRVVLQFNRLDFRLNWVRQYYPNAKIIHIYRHPREQWLSYVKSSEECSSLDDFNSLGSKDFFYIRRWGRDLRYVFPFLDESHLSHLYELYYLLWRLSYNQGVNYADCSVALEDFTSEPEVPMGKFLTLAGIDKEFMQKALEKVKKTPAKRWEIYAEDAWFEEKEGRCDSILSEYYFSRNAQIRS